MSTLTATIAAEVYGAGLGIFNPIALVWAAERAAQQIGAEAVKVEVRKINRIRDRAAVPPVVFPFGHPLF